jgi:hypothetical protein
MRTTIIDYCDIELEILYDGDEGETGDWFQPSVSPSIEIIAIRLTSDTNSTDIYELMREVDIKTIEEIVYNEYISYLQ